MAKPDADKNPEMDNPSLNSQSGPDGEPAAEAGSAPGSMGFGAESPEGDGDTKFAALKAERDELEARLMRTAADYQNYVRRAQQNVDQARQQQAGEIARALLTVLDHFDRALEIDVRKVTVEGLLAGVRIVRDELTKTLETFDIRRIPVQVGEEFNPHRHEALMRQQVEGLPANHVAAELAPGYTLGDRVLRPAKVSVTQ